MFKIFYLIVLIITQVISIQSAEVIEYKESLQKLIEILQNDESLQDIFKTVIPKDPEITKYLDLMENGQTQEAFEQMIKIIEKYRTKGKRVNEKSQNYQLLIKLLELQDLWSKKESTPSLLALKDNEE